MGQETNIYITKPDHEWLTKLIEIARERESHANREYLDRLEEELDRSEVVQQKNIREDVITMRSTVRVKDLDTNEEMIYRLVFPTEANYDEGRISVLAPIGTAMLGYRRGDVIEWQVPSGVRKLSVEEVLYQPESKGEYHLGVCWVDFRYAIDCSFAGFSHPSVAPCPMTMFTATMAIIKAATYAPCEIPSWFSPAHNFSTFPESARSAVSIRQDSEVTGG